MGCFLPLGAKFLPMEKSQMLTLWASVWFSLACMSACMPIYTTWGCKILFPQAPSSCISWHILRYHLSADTVKYCIEYQKASPSQMAAEKTGQAWCEIILRLLKALCGSDLYMQNKYSTFFVLASCNYKSSVTQEV